jgi:8-oxo-(d)GTP phosphatase
MSAEDAPVLAAGAVLWRPAPDLADIELALVHRPKYDDWSLPKGKRDPGEHLLETAVREVEEETGQRVALGRPLGVQRYPVLGRPKEVHYWAARGHHQAFVPTEEIDDLAWLPPAEAKRRLTHPRDHEFIDRLCAGPVATVPFVLLRHAKSVKRSAWGGEDADRPLDPRGKAQAERLVPILAAYGRLDVHSSDSVRCIDTVRPYARSQGVPIEIEPLLSEEGWTSSPEAALDRAAALLALGRPLVACTHRPLLPHVVTRLAATLQPGPPEPIEPGAFYALHAADGVVVALEKHSLPSSDEPDLFT